MNNPALLIIEEAYSMALNPELDYFAQLQPLAANGELANKITSNQVLFKLCMLVDAQAKDIKALRDRIQEIDTVKKEATDAKTPDPTQPITDPAV
jgi:hypothetical protein